MHCVAGKMNFGRNVCAPMFTLIASEFREQDTRIHFPARLGQGRHIEPGSQLKKPPDFSGGL